MMGDSVKNQWEVVADYINENPHMGFTNAEAYVFGGLKFDAFNEIETEVPLALGLYCFPHAKVYINNQFTGMLNDKGEATLPGLKPGKNTVIIQGHLTNV